MTISKLQRLLLWAAWLIAAVLLGRFAIDFFHEMPSWLAVPFALLVISALGVAAMNLIAADRRAMSASQGIKAKRIATALLLLSIPLGFLAASLDCTGLSLSGCTPFCTYIKTTLIPALAVACGIAIVRPSPILMGLILSMSFVPLWPHCLCVNVGNGWWIDWLGASPTCYAWGFTASLIALSAIRRGRHEWLSLLVNSAIVGGATVFFVGHHYFHYPW